MISVAVRVQHEVKTIKCVGLMNMDIILICISLWPQAEVESVPETEPPNDDEPDDVTLADDVGEEIDEIQQVVDDVKETETDEELHQPSASDDQQENANGDAGIRMSQWHQSKYIWVGECERCRCRKPRARREGRARSGGAPREQGLPVWGSGSYALGEFLNLYMIKH